MNDQTTRYWIRQNGVWQEVDLDGFVQMERRAGFHPKHGGSGIATGGFSTTEQGNLAGRITFGEVTKEQYDWDPDFFEATQRLTPLSPPTTP